MNLNSFMPVKLVTGAGCVRASAKELAKVGKVCLIVTGKTSARVSGALQDVTDTLDSNGQCWLLFDKIGQNPKLTDCMAAAQKAIAAGADFILGIGGGSALDAAKCIAVLAANPGMTQEQLYAFDWANAPLALADCFPVTIRQFLPSFASSFALVRTQPAPVTSFTGIKEFRFI